MVFYSHWGILLALREFYPPYCVMAITYPKGR